MVTGYVSGAIQCATMDQIQAAMTAAQPGDTIIITDSRLEDYNLKRFRIERGCSGFIGAVSFCMK